MDVIDVTGRGRLIIANDEGRKIVIPSLRIKPEPSTTLRKTEGASCYKSN
jgi:hypothetical protein